MLENADQAVIFQAPHRTVEVFNLTTVEHCQRHRRHGKAAQIYPAFLQVHDFV